MFIVPNELLSRLLLLEAVLSLVGLVGLALLKAVVVHSEMHIGAVSPLEGALLFLVAESYRINF